VETPASQGPVTMSFHSQDAQVDFWLLFHMSNTTSFHEQVDCYFCFSLAKSWNKPPLGYAPVDCYFACCWKKNSLPAATQHPCPGPHTCAPQPDTPHSGHVAMSLEGHMSWMLLPHLGLDALTCTHCQVPGTFPRMEHQLIVIFECNRQVSLVGCVKGYGYRVWGSIPQYYQAKNCAIHPAFSGLTWPGRKGTQRWHHGNPESYKTPHHGWLMMSSV